jgi:hypothetical protein
LPEWTASRSGVSPEADRARQDAKQWQHRSEAVPRLTEAIGGEVPGADAAALSGLRGGILDCA